MTSACVCMYAKLHARVLVEQGDLVDLFCDVREGSLAIRRKSEDVVFETQGSNSRLVQGEGIGCACFTWNDPDVQSTLTCSCWGV